MSWFSDHSVLHCFTSLSRPDENALARLYIDSGTCGLCTVPFLLYVSSSHHGPVPLVTSRSTNLPRISSSPLSYSCLVRRTAAITQCCPSHSLHVFSLMPLNLLHSVKKWISLSSLFWSHNTLHHSSVELSSPVQFQGIRPSHTIWWFCETWINYRWAATGDLPECMEVWPEKTPWTVPESRPWYQRAPMLLSHLFLIMPRIIFNGVV